MSTVFDQFEAQHRVFELGLSHRFFSRYREASLDARIKERRDNEPCRDP
jgi:hypothetical protein